MCKSYINFKKNNNNFVINEDGLLKNRKFKLKIVKIKNSKSKLKLHYEFRDNNVKMHKEKMAI